MQICNSECRTKKVYVLLLSAIVDPNSNKHILRCSVLYFDWFCVELCKSHVCHCGSNFVRLSLIGCVWSCRRIKSVSVDLIL